MKYRKAVTKTVAIGIIIIVIVAAIGVAAYFLLVPPKAPEFDVALFISNLGNPYFVALKNGSEAAVTELEQKGITVKLTVYDAKDDASLQTSQIETAVGQKVDAIVVNPVHKEAIQPALEKALKAGIPVVTTDRDVANKSLRICFTGTDNVEGGELAAKALIKALRESDKATPWKVVILNGIPGTTAAEERKTGFHNILDDFVDNNTIEIVAEEVSNFRRDEGQTDMETILSAHPDVDAVICANDEMALGAILAIEGADKTPGEDIIVVGYDAIPDAVQAIKDGEMYATIAQSPFLQGYWGVLIAYYHVFKDWQPTEDFIPTPLVVVTSENVETFSEEVASPKPLPGAPST